MHRGPQAHAQPFALQSAAGPNAALLIDFDNVTLGIQKDLGKELRNLLGSDIIKGKVSVQRAYADWRRYPQYVVPLAESSIDMIMAPAYGSAKKNATDIRLAIDAMELIFTRPEIGTFILLSGDSDFSSLVVKLKEYGKYVIGVGIRESASDLLVQNCDEYYSYNALAGLAKSTDEVPVARDPWELVSEAIAKMKRQGDVMRSDRLKQVMQELDPSFDEKDLGYSKFSRFVTEAASKGLVTLTKLENGQLEVSVPAGAAVDGAAEPREERGDRPEREEREGRRGRGRRGRGRGRDRDRGPRADGEAVDGVEAVIADAAAVSAAPRPAAVPSDDIGMDGERLTRDEALDLVRRAVEALVSGDDAVPSEAVRKKARELLGRDSESLALRFFDRILKDAHTAGNLDLRRRGDSFEVARIAESTVADQLTAAAKANAPAPAPASTAPRGLGPRGIPAKGKKGAPPPDLLMIGVVEDAAPVAVAAPVVAGAPVDAPAPAAKPAKGKKAAPKAEKAPAKPKAAAKSAKPAAEKKVAKPKAKKAAAE
ncbi:MAG: NYN domain-containing protein [Gemmatimonadaceae bacterium]|nr:NYN domain-containing protein [Gemmatimonadaceae bacterium]